jgi:hypothetical protein
MSGREKEERRKGSRSQHKNTESSYSPHTTPFPNP